MLSDGKSVAVYDCVNEKTLTPSDYTWIDMDDYGTAKYITAENGEKECYLDENFVQASDWYDSASMFCDGIALVGTEGKVHVINEEFEQISDDFDGIAAWRLYSGSTYGVVEKEDGRHLFKCEIEY